MKHLWLLQVLTVLNIKSIVCHDWKPIVGPASAVASIKATSAPFTSSFSLQQSHPDFVAKNTFGSVASDGKVEQTAFPGSSEPIKGNLKSPSLTATLPSAINFNDEKFGYLPMGYVEDQCAVKKYAFNQDGVVHYDNKLPELTQFTMCFWTRFTNHSGDHVIITYSTKDVEREIQFWVANARNSSFISMAVKGQQIYRLNYPLKVRIWHHTCTSWNGKTGEWQVWMKSERIGRGFHNALVSHKIPANGKLYSGGSSITGDVSNGLHFELTLLQIYRVALSAGKAHRDHKHHHAHHFDHEGKEIQLTTKAPPTINRPQAMSSLLANGQIPTQVRINLARPQPADMSAASQPAAQQALTIHTNFVNGQINVGSRLVAQQLVGLNHKPQTTQTVTRQPIYNPSNPSKIQFVDETETRILFKRHSNNLDTMDDGSSEADNKNLKKREIVFLDEGSLVPGHLDSGHRPDGLAEFGGEHFRNDKTSIEDEIEEHDHEPAEDEVKAVMTFCDACDIEPFQGAIVFAWKEAEEKLDNVLKGYSVGKCGQF